MEPHKAVWLAALTGSIMSNLINGSWWDLPILIAGLFLIDHLSEKAGKPNGRK